MKPWRPKNWRDILNRLAKPYEDANTPFDVGLCNTTADAILEALAQDVCKHPTFWQNCKSNVKRKAKICGDCPFNTIILRALDT